MFPVNNDLDSWHDGAEVFGIGVAPLPAALDGDAAVAPARTRLRVLVVEDGALTALEIANVLSEAGFIVIGPARTVSQALDLAARASCHAAVLDVRLRNAASEHVAHEFRGQGMPFVTLSGYLRDNLPPIFSEAAFIAKPLRPELLVRELTRCMEKQA